MKLGQRLEHCKRGHLRTPENVYGNNGCKRCELDRQKTKSARRIRAAYRSKWVRFATGKRSSQRATRRHNNGLKRRLSLANYRARRKGTKGTVTLKEWLTILAITGNCCACCGLSRIKLLSLKRVLCVEHILPTSQGGTNTADNVQPLCHGRTGSAGACNQVKGTKSVNYLKGWIAP